MGRFSSLQPLPGTADKVSSENGKVAGEEYAAGVEKVKVEGEREENGEDLSSLPTAINTGDTVIKQEKDEMEPPLQPLGMQSKVEEEGVHVPGKRLVVNRVENVMSSIAGAGSSEFDLYRKARRREQERLEQIERAHALEEERRAFHAKVLRNKLEAEERTRRNAEKRRMKKLKRKQRSGSQDGNQAPMEDSS